MDAGPRSINPSSLVAYLGDNGAVQVEEITDRQSESRRLAEISLKTGSSAGLPLALEGEWAFKRPPLPLPGGPSIIVPPPEQDVLPSEATPEAEVLDWFQKKLLKSSRNWSRTS
jgi:hypothetical protein